MAGLSFRFAAERGLRKRIKRSKVEGRARRNRGAADSVPAVAVPELHEDVLMAILARLPANALFRFKCVSRLWSSIISSRYFAKLFREAPSPLRERRLFMYLVDKDGHGDYALHSVLPWNLTTTCHSLREEVAIPGMGGCFVNALRGLMCSRIGRSVRICNLTTKQSVELPLVRSSILGDDFNTWNHFGYDPIKDEYKVFSLVWEIKQERVVRSEQQVLVLGLGSSWRRIAQSVPPHRPYSEGISIDGVLYYGAWTCEDTCVVMSFDMRSEEVTMIESPLEAGILWNTRATNLMNSRGKLAVFDYSHLERDGSIYLWVLEDGAGKRLWSNKKTFALPIVGIRLIFGGELFVRGTSREGKIRFFVNDYSSWHVICHLESCEMISGVQSSILLKRPFEAESLHTNYWDDFESIMYLEA